MLSDALKFWESIAGKVKQLIRGETQNAFRCERYEVSTAPNGSVMGVKKPFGNEILLPYSQEVSEASVGDPVLVVWWNSMSNAKVYYYANGYEGTTGGGDDEDSDVVIATISLPLSWNDSGSGYYTVTPTISGVLVSTDGKVDLQPSQAQTIQLQSDGVSALYVENNNGALTAYAIGNAPTAAIEMQCTVTGVTGVSPTNPYLDMVYPVGAVYTSVTSANPANLFGGTWEQIQDNALYMENEPLWTNPSPTSEFAAQTVSVDLSGYDFVAIKFLADTNSSSELANAMQMRTTKVGETGWAEHLLTTNSGSWPSNAYNGIRSYTVTTTGVDFGTCHERGVVHNTTTIPQAIYGIKSNGYYVWKRTA